MNPNERPPGVERNSQRGESLWTVNLRVAEQIPIGETNLQLIVEAFNVFNHTNPTGYVGNLTSPNFGEPTRTAAGVVRAAPDTVRPAGSICRDVEIR